MASVDYVKNPNQRTLCVLVLDASDSMNSRTPSGGVPINELNDGMREFEHSLKSDPAALTRVQLAIVSVGGPNDSADVLMDWTDCINFEAFPLTAAGRTPLAEGVLTALKLIENAKEQLRSNGINYTRPWMYVISDGEPTSDDTLWARAISECESAQAQRKVEIFSIAVEGANIEKLQKLSTRPVAQLKGLQFKELFQWITGTIKAAVNSRPGDTVNLPPTDPWRNVSI